MKWNEKDQDFQHVKQDTQGKPLSHPSSQRREKGDENYFLMQPIYTKDYLESIKPKHLPPETVPLLILLILNFNLYFKKIQKMAYNTIQTVRKVFDIVTGYGPNMTEVNKLF